MSADRLIVKETWLIPESHAGRKIGCSTNKEKDFNDYAHIVCTVNGRHRDNAADARRLAVCWNAMRAFSTDSIERAEIDLVELQQQVAAARALLAEMMKLDDEDRIYSTEWDLTGSTDEFVDLAGRIRAFLAEEAT